MPDPAILSAMLAVPATLALGARFDVQTSVVAAIISAGWELAALVRPLLGLPIAALALALLNEVVLPALTVLANAD